MNSAHECEVIEVLDTGWCLCCHRYREIFLALVPYSTRPSEVVEVCAKCLQWIAEEVQQSGVLEEV